MRTSVYIIFLRKGNLLRPEQIARSLTYTLAVAVACLIFSSSLSAQPYGTDIRRGDVEPEDYHESALRRFEIVFTISIPFSALHSYLAVRSVEMIKQSKVSPEMSSGDWSSVGGLTILFSSFIAFWDYMHTRGEDIKARRGTTAIPIEPVSLSFPASGAGYTHLMMPREPVLTLLSARF